MGFPVFAFNGIDYFSHEIYTHSLLSEPILKYDLKMI